MFLNKENLEVSPEICFTCGKPFKNKYKMEKQELVRFLLCEECCSKIIKEQTNEEED